MIYRISNHNFRATFIIIVHTPEGVRRMQQFFAVIAGGKLISKLKIFSFENCASARV